MPLFFSLYKGGNKGKQGLALRLQASNPTITANLIAASRIGDDVQRLWPPATMEIKPGHTSTTNAITHDVDQIKRRSCVIARLVAVVAEQRGNW